MTEDELTDAVVDLQRGQALLHADMETLSIDVALVRLDMRRNFERIDQKFEVVDAKLDRIATAIEAGFAGVMGAITDVRRDLADHTHGADGRTVL